MSRARTFWASPGTVWMNSPSALGSLFPGWARSLWHYHGEMLQFHTNLDAAPGGVSFALADGTGVTQPRYATWFSGGVGWGVENFGVACDFMMSEVLAILIAP